MLHEARALLAAGLSVLCVEPERKKPYYAWASYQTVQPTLGDLPGLFDYPDPRIGIATGVASGNLEVIDFDVPAWLRTPEGNDAPAYLPWREIIEAHGGDELLKRLVLCQTPSGGIHVLYRCNTIDGNTKLAQRPWPPDIPRRAPDPLTKEPGDPDRGSLIETRGRGGFIVAAPSPGYRVIQGSLAAIPTIEEDERELLLGAARLLDEMPAAPMPEPREARPFTPGALSPGDDFDLRGTWEEILEPAGWRRMPKTWQGMTLWVRPGKRPSDGWSARTGVGTAGDRLVSWSTSAPFPTERALKKYYVYAVLRHGGDVAAAIKDLAARGFGSKPAVGRPLMPAWDADEPSARVTSSPVPRNQYFDPLIGAYRDFQPNDKGNAERFIAWFGKDLRHVAATGWHVWDGERWRKGPEGTLHAKWLAMHVSDRVIELARDATGSDRKELLSLAGKLCNKSLLESMVALAASFPQIAAALEDFDKDPLLLGTLNGTLDLRTSTLRPADPADMITMRTACPFEESECPLFTRFLGEITLGREPMMQFLMFSLGYSLSGLMTPAAFWFLFGKGDNGKSILTGLAQRIMGEYATTLMPDSIMVKKNEQIPADIAKLQGKRLVVVPEVDDSRKLNTSVLKALTSNEEKITARFLNANYVDFYSGSKLWLTGNQKPLVGNFDKALRRRINVVPFEFAPEPEQRDEDLGAKLWAEAPGVLWLFVQAFREFYAVRRLPHVQEIEDATEEYQKESDYVGQFLDEECEITGGQERLSKSALRERYVKWCKTNGLLPLSRNKLYDRLRAAGLGDAATMTDGTYPFVGISLRSENAV